MNTMNRFENACAAKHAAIVTAELVKHYLPRMAEIGCADGIPASMLVVDDPAADYALARFAPFFLDEAEVLAAYRARTAS